VPARRALVLLACLAVVGAVIAVPASSQTPGDDPVAGARILHPSDRDLTVGDAQQATGRRLALPLPDCAIFPSDCHELQILNGLDGFDLNPRIAIQLAAQPAADLADAFSEDVAYVERLGDAQRIGLDRLVYDDETRILYANPREQLAEGRRHRIVVGQASSEFTTLSASAGLLSMRRQLDDGSAYEAAQITDDERSLSFLQGETRTVFAAPNVAQITRFNQTTPDGPLVSETVINTALAQAGTYAFGSFASPSWLDADRTIAQTPTGGDGPAVTGSERVGVTLILPLGTPPPGGFPVAIFGPGITRSKYDLFLAADFNAQRGLATMSLDPAGHAFGPRTQTGVRMFAPPTEVRFSGFGRGRDLDGDGIITNQEGVSAPRFPHPKAAIALRDGLRQTAADVMALVRAIGRGVDVDGNGTEDLRRDGVSLYAQSLGGIYGSMVMGVDPQVKVGVLNVPGGPIEDIANLAPVFRPLVRDALRDRVPGVLNGGRSRYTESLPLRLDPPVTTPAIGALEIQDIFSRINWINRPGSPEAFAPLIRRSPPADSEPKEVIYQFAFGDQTVPNPTSGTLARAFGDMGRVTLYRNDLTATRSTNPHGFLLDPRVQGRNQAQRQVVDYIASGGRTVTDPDGGAPTFEVPIANPDSLETVNFPASLYGANLPAPLQRFSGPDRIATSVDVSRELIAQTATVVVARADGYADALAGAPLAAHLGAPLLLTGRDGLAPIVAEEVRRLGATEAVLLGGEAALSPAVASGLEAAGATPRRVGGSNRYGTAALIAAELSDVSELFLTEGDNADRFRGWPDALSASGLAAALRQPILLTEQDALPIETADALKGARVTIVGGEAAVGAGVATAVADAGSAVSRLSGDNRYATSAEVAREATRRNIGKAIVWLATGLDYPDGLVAGAAAGRDRSVLLLINGQDLDGSAATRDFLLDNEDAIKTLRVSGGAAAVSVPVEVELRALTDPEATAGSPE